MTTEFADLAATDAAILQLLEEPVAKSASVARLPSAVLFDWVVEAILPAVATYSVAKNVPLEEAEHVLVAQYAAWHLPKQTQHRLKRGESDAVLDAQLAVNHALDIEAITRFFRAVLKREGRDYLSPAQLIDMAEASLAKQSANDTRPPKYTWPDLDAMLESHYDLVATGECPMVTLPAQAPRQCMVQHLRAKKRRPRKSGAHSA